MYPPSEDSFFLAKFVKEECRKLEKQGKILDMGSGSGIQAEAVLEAGINKKNIICVDIDKEVVSSLKKKGFYAIQSDLFSKIKDKFDIIIFNPPYLPEDKREKGIDTSGGKKGDEIILKFLKQAGKHLEKNGKILLLLSSLTPRKKLEKELEKQELGFKKLGEERLFMEILELWEITSSHKFL